MNSGEIVKKIRDSLFYTREEFSKLFDIDAISVYNWETNRKSPSRKHVRKLAELASQQNIKVTFSDFVKKPSKDKK